jgi:hypothetical protein
MPYVTSRALEVAAPAAEKPVPAQDAPARPNPYGATMRGGPQP